MTAIDRSPARNPDLEVNVKSNYHERDLLYGWDLTKAERDEIDYVNWQAIEEGSDSWSGFRYRGSIYDLGEFQAFDDKYWHGWMTQSAFDAIVVRYNESQDGIIIGHMYW